MLWQAKTVNGLGQATDEEYEERCHTDDADPRRHQVPRPTPPASMPAIFRPCNTIIQKPARSHARSGNRRRNMYASGTTLTLPSTKRSPPTG